MGKNINKPRINKLLEDINQQISPEDSLLEKKQKQKQKNKANLKKKAQEKAISTSQKINGYRNGESLEKQVKNQKILADKANSRKERQISDEEKQNQNSRVRAYEDRQIVRERGSRGR